MTISERLTNLLDRVAPSITALAALGAVVATFWIHYADDRAGAHERLLEHRRAALVLALQVIDHVYANEPLDAGKPFDPHEWDIQLARDADNQMRIYCGDPRTRETFIRALGLYNPTTAKPAGINLTAFDEFRKQVARELDLPEPTSNPDMVWISHLAGAERQTSERAK